VLVADFVNTTGDPVFDSTLKRAVEVKLGESPHFNVLNEPNLRATLRLMERSPAVRLVPPLDREVCQRAGAKVVIGGSIVALGDAYTLSLDARNCLTGEAVAHEEGRASGRERVLPTLGEMLPPLRRRLGESLATIERFNTPIAQATTPSLSALKAYAMGDENRLQDKEEESLAFYKMAVELDPQFAIAWARLAAVHRVLGQYDLSREAMAKAFQLREHVSEREKLYIAAHYYVDFTRDFDKAIRTYELWTQTYPRDWIPYNNLADVASQSGLYAKAIPAGQQALRLNPNSWFAYGTLANAYLRAGQYAEAKAICERAAAEHHVAPAVAFTMSRLPYALGDRAAIDAEIAAAGPQRDALVLAYVAQATTGLGRLGKARELYAQALQGLLQRGEKEFASNSAYDESLAEAELGDAAAARADVARALEWNPDPAAGVYAASTLARVGDYGRAAQLARAADVRPDDTLHNAVALPAARAAIALAQKQPQRAIEALSAALPYDLSEIANGETLYLRGVAYLELGSAQAAAAQFQRLIDNHGSALTVYWPLAHLGLARAEVAAGKPEEALKAYESLLALWSDADPELPVVQQARAEYQRLKSGGS
jgi:tetratricopeptide (TPR) repeat protein